MFKGIGGIAGRPFPAHLRPAQRPLSAVRPGAAASAAGGRTGGRTGRPAAMRWEEARPRDRSRTGRHSRCPRSGPGSRSARPLRGTAGGRSHSLRRGFRIEPGEKAYVVEDVVTTGGSTRETMDVVTQAGGIVIAAGSLIDRSGGRTDLGVPRAALAVLDVPAFPPEECPLCKTGSQAIKPGSR